MFWQIALEVIPILNIFLIITIIFFEHKNPVSALAWVIALIFLPLIGFIAYILFGANPRFKMRRNFLEKAETDSAYFNELNQQIDIIKRQKDADDDALDQNITSTLADLVYLNITNSSSVYTFNNDIAVFTDGNTKYDALLEDLAAAKETIHMIYFIFRHDEIGTKIRDILAAKAKDGVEVRLMVDDIGSFFTPMAFFRPIMAAGGKVVKFMPALFHLPRINYRNHRKIVVIDGQLAYMGGMNIGDEYASKKHLTWRDTHLRIKGSAVLVLQMRFFSDWFYSVKENFDFDQVFSDKYFPAKVANYPGQIGMQIVSSGPDRNIPSIKLGYMKMLSLARHDIYIQTPYFIPDAVFLETLQLAAMSGIRIHIMIPGEFDKFWVYKATFSYIQHLIGYENVAFYLYKGFLHSKAMVIDDNLVSIGTTNIDIRSFYLDFEINSFIYNAAFANRYIEIFNQDIENCTLLTINEYQKRGNVQKASEAIAHLFSPLF